MGAEQGCSANVHRFVTGRVAVRPAEEHDARMSEPRVEPGVTRPWATKRPQSLVLSVVIVAILIAVIASAVAAVADGRGGIVPVLMLLGAPVIGGAYLIYLNGTRWE